MPSINPLPTEYPNLVANNRWIFASAQIQAAEGGTSSLCRVNGERASLKNGPATKIEPGKVKMGNWFNRHANEFERNLCGKIDEFMIWEKTRCLSAEEIKGLYEAGKPGDPYFSRRKIIFFSKVGNPFSSHNLFILFGSSRILSVEKILDVNSFTLVMHYLSFLCALVIPLALFPLVTYDFNRDVRPILSDKCFSCHGPDEEGRKADLRLDIEEYAKDENMMAIVAGEPEESEIFFRIHSDDEDELMPPPEIGKPLSEKEKDILEQWIAEGAPWADHWAYVKPKWTDPPMPKNSDWSGHWIDRFTLTDTESKKLQPAKDADPVSLVRRLHFDLTGLPPASKDRKIIRTRPEPSCLPSPG